MNFSGMCDVTYWKNCLDLRTQDGRVFEVHEEGFEKYKKYDGMHVYVRIKDGRITNMNETFWY